MRLLRVLPLVAGTLLLSCSSHDAGSPPDNQSPEEEGQIVPPGKEDNFLSNTAQEYMVEGLSTVTIEASLASAPDDQKLGRVRELIALKQIVIGWFLNQYIATKEGEESNASYGGFNALTKNGAYEELDIAALDATTYQFKFRQEFGGALDLLARIPATTCQTNRKCFDLTIGKISNEEMQQLETNNEWYRRPPWDSFDPSKVDPSLLEKVTLAVWPEPRSYDAWFDYNRLFADGKVTIGLHFGWDYHSEYHLKHSREVYDWLVGSEGFKSPVASYDDLTRTSGPLTKTIQANGKPVTVEVSLYWGKPGTDTDPDTSSGGKTLESDMRQSFKDKEIIMFSGHSGPFYGFALANWRKTDEGDLDDTEIPGLDMPADTYQVVVAEGCDTYALGEAFRLNPAKQGGKNIDVVTTTSFSNAATAEGIKDTLRTIYGTDASGNQKPLTFVEYLRAMDANSPWFTTMYGVHGLDDNPHGHPYGRPDLACTPCTTDQDCGGVGNKCTRLGTSEKFCTYFCTADDGCPSGYQCLPVAQGSTITSKQCAPSNLTCTVAPPQPSGPAVIINEVFASPKAGSGDANGDGTVSATDDEFIELVNVSNKEVDLTGWTIADSYMTRYVFPAGTKLPAGKALVLFAGGKQSAFPAFGGATVLLSVQNKLGLNNGGDRVTLVDKSGDTVSEMSYGAEGGGGKSLVRATDGDPAASFVVHGGSGYSPGVRTDGSPF